MSDRKLVTLEGTIVGCHCKVVCDSEHVHTLEHGPDGDTGAPGSSIPNYKELDFRYFPMQSATHSIKIGCQCSPTRNGKHVNVGSHIHVRTTGPKGIRGVEGLLYGPHPDLSVLDRRYIIVIEDCKSCIKEKEPHDHAVLEGMRGKQGPTIN